MTPEQKQELTKIADYLLKEVMATQLDLSVILPRKKVVSIMQTLNGIVKPDESTCNSVCEKDGKNATCMLVCGKKHILFDK